MKKTRRISVFNQEQYDGEWPPEAVDDFLRWLNGKIELIPEEYRANSEIEIDSVSGYEGEHYARIEISYTREETDVEEQLRERDELLSRQRAEARDRRVLEELKAKYGES